jgi:purine-binding chemotaxis protein CheW
MAEPLRLCTFLLGGRTFALPVSEIREVVRGLEMTPVPLAPGAVRGLVNLRGTIAMAIDLRRRLDLPAAVAGEGEVSVVVDADDGPVCLTVDDVGDVVEVNPAALERPPETLRAALRDVVRSICKREDELILVLDTPKAIDAGAPRGSTGSPRTAASAANT